MAAICAKKTAGVDVNRTLRIAAADVAVERIATFLNTAAMAKVILTSPTSAESIGAVTSGRR
jgi:hypothetical protein